MKMLRANIFIDGGNFYHLVLKKMGIGELDFDFEKFAQFLAREKEIPDKGKRFYVGTVPEIEGDLESKEAMSKQNKLFSKLINNHWEIKTSKLRRRTEELIIDNRVKEYDQLYKLGIQKIHYERLREKGIDVKLATDLIVGAIDNKYDVAIIVSSDTDLIPAIDWVHYRTQKRIEYVGFSITDNDDDKKSTKPSITLINKTSSQRIITLSDIKQFVIE